MTKEDLVLALLNEGVEGFMEVKVPELPDLPAPVADDIDANSYTLASYAVNCNKFLQCFNGLYLFDFLLRGLQRSNPMIALAMASLEGGTQGDGRVIFSSPDTDAVCQGYVRVVVETSSDVNDISIDIGGISRYMSHISAGVFESRYLLPVGPYTININAERTEGDIQKSRNFSIAGFEHDPGDAYIPVGNYECMIACFGAEDLIASITAKIPSSDEIVLDREEREFNGFLTFPVGESNLDFHIYPANFPDYHQYQLVVAEE